MRALYKACLVTCSFAFVFGATPSGLTTDMTGIPAAYAKGGNGGGHGGGGHGGGNGNGGGNSGNASAGKSGAAQGGSSEKSKSPGGNGLSRFADKVFGIKGISAQKPAVAKAPQSLDKRFAKVAPHGKKAKVETVAAVREKNFNAKLAGLNSLKRNANAYLNAKDPRMQAIRTFALAAIALEDAKALAIEKADALTSATTALAAIVSGVKSYDGTFDYSTADLATLDDRLAALNAVDDATLSEVDAQALADEISNLSAALDGPEGVAYTKATDELAVTGDKVASLETAADDDALTQALMAAANKNRVTEYGDAYVDQQMLDWAKNLLGVGDAVGKIDEMRATLKTAEASETEAVETSPEL